MRLPSLLAIAFLLLPSGAALAPVPVAPEHPGLVAAHALLHDGDWLGKSPADWMAWARARAALPAGVSSDERDLGRAVQSVYAAVGLVPTDAQTTELQASIAALDPREAALLAPLVDAVAQAYVVQATQVVPLVDLDAVRHAPGAPFDHARDPALATAPVLPDAAARIAVANGEHVLGAIGAFQARFEARAPDVRLTSFRDPLGLVVVGGPGSNTYEPDGVLGDPVLLLGLGGNDVDHTSAGGACPITQVDNGMTLCNGLAVSVRAAMPGTDRYEFRQDHRVAQGSGALGGLGILVDAGGDDTYLVEQHIDFEPTLLHKAQLNYMTNVVQGSGEGGVGFLVDVAGNDRYQFNLTGAGITDWAQGQGFAGLGGVGVLLDTAGDDVYDTQVQCTGSGNWCGLYVAGTALYGGVAIQLDHAGNDRYTGVVVAPQEDYYSQAFAAFGGLAIQVDDAGNDQYLDIAITTANGSFGVSLNCAYGTAEYAGAVGIFIDGAGDDSYISATYDPIHAADTMSEGFALASGALFWDVSGTDYHSMRSYGPAPHVIGRGAGSSLLEKQAVYLDTGGRDTYADVPGSQTVGGDGRTWGNRVSAAGQSVTVISGFDLNLVPSVAP